MMFDLIFYRFAHIINIDYFDDLLKVLNNLQVKENFPQRQALLCIVTVLAVLDGQGSVLALDPTVFHKSLYGHLITLHCGKYKSILYFTCYTLFLTTDFIFSLHRIINNWLLQLL